MLPFPHPAPSAFAEHGDPDPLAIPTIFIRIRAESGPLATDMPVWPATGERETDARNLLEQRPRNAAALSRRHLLVLTAAATFAATGTTARHAAAEATPTAGAGAGAWRFTDDAGTTVTLPDRPAKVAADISAATSLWDFGVRPVAVSGWMTNTDAAWGEVDRTLPLLSAAGTPAPGPERLLATGADLFVTLWYANPDNPYDWSFPDRADYELARAVVPVVAISATGCADANIERFAELAALLGADITLPEIAAAKDDYDRALGELRAVAAEKPDLKVLFVSATSDTRYVAHPGTWSDLALFQSVGLNAVEPELGIDPYWEQLSPEQALKYPADVVFRALNGALSLEELQAHPTYGLIPAVKAGQAYAWNQDSVQSYAGMTAAVQEVANALKQAKDITP